MSFVVGFVISPSIIEYLLIEQFYVENSRIVETLMHEILIVEIQEHNVYDCSSWIVEDARIKVENYITPEL